MTKESNNVVSFVAPQNLKRKIRMAAAREDKSMGQFIREILIERFKEEEK